MPDTTEDVQFAQEWAARDPWAFATQFVKTEDPQAENPIRAFPAYGYLERFFKALQQFKLVAVGKSRQLLFSWAVCVYVIWVAAFHPHKQVMVQSQKEDKSKALIIRMKFILHHLPPWLLQSEYAIRSGQITFTFPDGNTSRIWSVPQGPDQVASYSPSIVVFDEMALQEHAKAAYQAAIPALRTGGQLVGISSPRADAFFTKFCKGIKAVHYISAHYTDHPDYAAEAERMGGWEAWVKEKRALWGYESDAMWDREMEINFDVTGGVPAFKPPFDVRTHVAEGTLVANPVKPVQRGWDFGYHHPACVWTQIADNGQWVILRELVVKDMDLPTFVGKVAAVSKELVPFGGPDAFQDYCDPEGFKKHRAVGGPSVVELLHERGIFPLNGPRKIPVKETVILIRKNLRIVPIVNAVTGVREKRPGTLIDPSCEYLIRAFNGAYGTKTDDDEKFVGGMTQHPVDALRYIAAGIFNLGRAPRKKKRLMVA